MSDINSELPIRTQLPGQLNVDDVIIKIADGTVSTQLAAVDTHGSQQSTIADSSGNIVTSQANGGQRALDVGIDVAGVQIDPRQIRALTAADVVTAQQGTSPWVTKDQADGPVTPGTVASFSGLIGGQYNATLPTLTDTQQSAIQVDSRGRLLVESASLDDHNYGTVGANTLRTAAQIGNATGAADFNYGTAGAQTLRVAAQIGNATGAADFNNGATGAQTLRVAANLAVGGANVSVTNPVPVTLDTVSGTSVNDYKRAVAIAVGATDNHDYTVTAGKTLYFDQIEASASGKAKMEVEIETGVATNVFNTFFVQFNSTSTPIMSLILSNPITVAAGVRVRVVLTNKDVAAEDMYSTISGKEL
jgi:hypothetical protein